MITITCQPRLKRNMLNPLSIRGSSIYLISLQPFIRSKILKSQYKIPTKPTDTDLILKQ